MELTLQNPCEILHKIDGLWGSRFQVVPELCLVDSDLVMSVIYFWWFTLFQVMGNFKNVRALCEYQVRTHINLFYPTFHSLRGGSLQKFV